MDDKKTQAQQNPDTEQQANQTDQNKARRRLLKTAAIGGGAIGLQSLPGAWTKPIVASVVLPAHGQSSALCSGTLTNCEQGVFGTSSGSSGSQLLSTAGFFDDLLGWVGDDTAGAFNGTSSFSTVINDFDDELSGMCGECVADGDPGKYLTLSATADGAGSLAKYFSSEITCNNEAVFQSSFSMSGTQTGVDNGTAYYDMNFSTTIDFCPDNLDL